MMRKVLQLLSAMDHATGSYDYKYDGFKNKFVEKLQTSQRDTIKHLIISVAWLNYNAGRFDGTSRFESLKD
jgi:hypothetical protein